MQTEMVPMISHIVFLSLGHGNNSPLGLAALIPDRVTFQALLRTSCQLQMVTPKPLPDFHSGFSTFSPIYDSYMVPRTVGRFPHGKLLKNDDRTDQIYHSLNRVLDVYMEQSSNPATQTGFLQSKRQ